MFICLEEGNRWLPLIFTPSVGTQSSVAKPTCGFPVGSPWGLSLWDVIIQSQYSIKLRCIIHCDLYPNCFQDIPNHEISLQCSKKPCNIFNCNTHSCVYLDWSPAVISWNKKNKRKPLHCQLQLKFQLKNVNWMACLTFHVRHRGTGVLWFWHTGPEGIWITSIWRN